MNRVTLRQLLPYESDFLKEGTTLLNQLQGVGLFSDDYLEIRAKDPLSHVVGAFNNQLLIGVAVAQVLESLEYYRLFNSDFVDQLHGQCVGSLSTMSVHKQYQGTGIGQQLGRMRLDWLIKQKCKTAVGVSWVSQQAHTSDRVFLKLGFKEIARHNTFYAQSSLDKHFICPTCGEPPCLCPAILFAKQELC